MTWRVEVHRGEWISVCGPDYEQETEFRVIDEGTGRTVLVLTETGEWPYLVSPSYAGVESARVLEDGGTLEVRHHDGHVERIALAGLEAPPP